MKTVLAAEVQGAIDEMLPQFSVSLENLAPINKTRLVLVKAESEDGKARVSKGRAISTHEFEGKTYLVCTS